jgi:UDP-2-acetamido-3-amino-2,3-dideoxy-glucuronate N-acetyltransferase
VTYWAHVSAVVDEPATIGDDTKIWHFCHVMAGARIGARCSLGQNVFVAAAAVIGDGCKIQNNVSIYDGVTLADDVFVGPSAVFTNVVNPRAFIVRKAEYQRTEVERGASIGANATIVCGCRIGAFAFVAAGAVVTHDVAPYALVAGVPARRIGWACRCGVTLPEGLVCSECGERYAIEGERLTAAQSPGT